MTKRPPLMVIRKPIEDWNEELGVYDICVPTLKTKLSNGAYDAVAWRISMDGDEVNVYQKAKARLWVRNGEFVPYTVLNVCKELVASDPHHWALEGFAQLNSKTVELIFG